MEVFACVISAIKIDTEEVDEKDPQWQSLKRDINQACFILGAQTISNLHESWYD